MSQPIPVAIVIEDEPNIRRLIKMALEAEQFQVFEAATVSRGLIEAGSRQPDVVLVDLGLPDGTGIDFIRDIRAWSDVPIIVVSARTHEDNKIEALNIGADDYLSKPFSPGELVARVLAQLRRRSMASDKGETIFKFGNINVDLTKINLFVNRIMVIMQPVMMLILSLTFLEVMTRVTDSRGRGQHSA